MHIMERWFRTKREAIKRVTEVIKPYEGCDIPFHTLLRGIAPVFLKSKSMGDLVEYCAGLTWAAQYRHDKRIYQIDPRLSQAFIGMRFPENYPTEHLLFPAEAILLETLCWTPDVPPQPAYLLVQRNYIDDEMTQALVVSAITVATANEGIPTIDRMLAVPNIIPLNKPTLGECFSEAMTREGEPDDQDYAKEVLRTVFNALLYIQHEEDTVRLVHPGERPVKTSHNKHKAQRFAEIADPGIFSVGTKYGRAIEHWEIENSNVTGNTVTGKSVRPHIRAPHPHLYWTGPGRTTPKVNYLGMIRVKGGGDSPMDENSDPKTINVR